MFSVGPDFFRRTSEQQQQRGTECLTLPRAQRLSALRHLMTQNWAGTCLFYESLKVRTEDRCSWLRAPVSLFPGKPPGVSPSHLFLRLPVPQMVRVSLNSSGQPLPPSASSGQGTGDDFTSTFHRGQVSKGEGV